MKKCRPLWMLGLTVLTLIGMNGCNRGTSVQAAMNDQTPAVSEVERDFMTKATQLNLAEILMARLAVIKSSNNDVRDLARMVQSEHSGILEDLTDLMKAENVSRLDTLPDQTQQDIARMSTLSGAEFDREFTNTLVTDHQRIIEMFRDQSTTAQHPDVKAYAEATLPVLELHLQNAQRIQSSLFSKGARS